MCEDRIGKGPPRARTEVIYVDLGYTSVLRLCGRALRSHPMCWCLADPCHTCCAHPRLHPVCRNKPHVESRSLLLNGACPQRLACPQTVLLLPATTVNSHRRERRCRANMAHTRQSRPDSGLSFPRKTEPLLNRFFLARKRPCTRGQLRALQGYLAHKKTPTPPGPP